MKLIIFENPKIIDFTEQIKISEIIKSGLCKIRELKFVIIINIYLFLTVWAKQGGTNKYIIISCSRTHAHRGCDG